MLRESKEILGQLDLVEDKEFKAALGRVDSNELRDYKEFREV